MSSRTRSMLLAATAVLLTACGVTPTNTSLAGSNAPYFIGNRVVTVDRDYLHRYACADGAPLECRCSSPRFGRCDCKC